MYVPSQYLPSTNFDTLFQLASYLPAVFFVTPEGDVMNEVTNDFAPTLQDPRYKYHYDVESLILQMRYFFKKYAPPPTNTAASATPTPTSSPKVEL